MSAKGTIEALETGGWAEVQRMITDKEAESVHLDFKQVDGAAKASLTDDDIARVSKAVSAFANVEGGVLLLGVRAEGPKNEPDRATNIVTIANVLAAQNQLDRLATSLTDPPVPGLRVVAIADPSNAPAGVLAVYAPQSDGGPHQAARGEGKGRYFMRTSTSSTPAPHAILAGMFGRRPVPRLRLAVRYNLTQRIVIYVINEGRGLAENVLLRLTIRTKDGHTMTTSSEVGPFWVRWNQGALLPLDRYSTDITHQTVLHAGDSSPAYSFESQGYGGGFSLRARIDARGMSPAFIETLVNVSYDLARIPTVGEEQGSQLEKEA